MQKKVVKKFCLALEHLAFLLSIYTGRSFVSSEFFRSHLLVIRGFEENQYFGEEPCSAKGLLNERDVSSPSLCSNREQSYISLSFLLK